MASTTFKQVLCLLACMAIAAPAQPIWDHLASVDPAVPLAAVIAESGPDSDVEGGGPSFMPPAPGFNLDPNTPNPELHSDENGLTDVTIVAPPPPQVVDKEDADVAMPPSPDFIPDPNVPNPEQNGNSDGPTDVIITPVPVEVDPVDVKSPPESVSADSQLMPESVLEEDDANRHALLEPVVNHTAPVTPSRATPPSAPIHNHAGPAATAPVSTNDVGSTASTTTVPAAGSAWPALRPTRCGAMTSPPAVGAGLDVTACNNVKVGKSCLVKSGTAVQQFTCERSATSPAGWRYTAVLSAGEAAMFSSQSDVPSQHCGARNRGIRVTCQSNGKWTYVCNKGHRKN